MTSLGLSAELKAKQVEALRAAYEKQDVIAVLPTGYGKSLVYQLMPWVIQRREHSEEPMIAIVVSPLNSVMQDQVVSMTEKGVKACYLNISGTGGSTYEVMAGSSDQALSHDSDSDIDEAQEIVPIFTEKSVSLAALRDGKYVLVYAHPEAVVSNNQMGKLLRSSVYRKRVGCIAVDEVHMVAEWGDDFRQSFTKLGELNALFPDAAHLAMTVTLTSSTINKLTDILQLENPTIVTCSPDRPNIHLEVKTRLPNIHQLDKFDDLVNPLYIGLNQLQLTFPVKIVYVDNLDALWYSYQYLDQKLGKRGYLPNKPNTPENRLFAMYHKDYTQKMKSLIVQELRKENPTVRLVLATVALGMGLNAPSVSRVIHFRPPTTLEKYVQEIGRAGRSGQPAQAIMYYNNSDIATNRPGLSQDIVKFCRNDSSCLRKMLLAYFGSSEVLYAGSPSGCCSNCSKVMYINIPYFLNHFTTYATNILKHFQRTMRCREIICT